MSILRRGLRGEPVRRLQAKLGVEADGIFGPATEKALREYQGAHGLAVDGLAGPETFAQMGLPELILLQVGSRGPLVKRLQKTLGVADDGIFGPGTKKALEKFQQDHGLTADGLAGPLTLAQMTLFEQEITPAVVAQSVLPEDYDPIPPLPMSEYTPALDSPPEVAQAAPGATQEEKPGISVWSTVKGWFS